MISILVATLYNIDYLNLFCRSVEMHTTVPYEICIWNNEADSEIRDMCKAKGYTYYESKENLVIDKPYNIMAENAKYDLIFIADNDYYVLPGWDAITQYDTDVYWKRPAMIDHRPSWYPGSTIKSIEANYGTDIKNFREDDLIRELNGLNVPEINGTHMPPVMLKQDFINIGGFAEGYFMNEHDFLWRCYKYYTNAGFKQVTSTNSFIYHFGEKTNRNYNKKDDTIKKAEQLRIEYKMDHEEMKRIMGM